MSDIIKAKKSNDGYDVTLSINYLDEHKDSGFYVVLNADDPTTFDYDEMDKAIQFFDDIK